MPGSNRCEESIFIRFIVICHALISYTISHRNLTLITSSWYASSCAHKSSSNRTRITSLVSIFSTHNEGSIDKSLIMIFSPQKKKCKLQETYKSNLYSVPNLLYGLGIKKAVIGFCIRNYIKKVGWNLYIVN